MSPEKLIELRDDYYRYQKEIVAATKEINNNKASSLAIQIAVTLADLCDTARLVGDCDLNKCATACRPRIEIPHQGYYPSIIDSVGGQLKPASNGHFLKPKTGHLEIPLQSKNSSSFLEASTERLLRWGTYSRWSKSSRFKCLLGLAGEIERYTARPDVIAKRSQKSESSTKRS